MVLVGGWVLAGHMLTPLTRITEAARMATNGSLSHRIRLPGRRDEFHELADAFDIMLAQLEAHVGEQRRFAANASHELRTPLAVAQTLLDVARKDPDRDTAELIERLRSVNTRAIDLTGALLLLRAPTGGPSPGNTSTCPSWRRRPQKHSSPSRRSSTSLSRRPAESLSPPAHPLSCGS